jgi:DNA-binding transcriptional regulator YiaG
MKNEMSGPELRAARERIGLSQEKLARRLNVTGKAMMNWENAKHRVPGPVAVAIGYMLAELEAKGRVAA